MSKALGMSDRKLLLVMGGVIAALIVGVSVLAPQRAQDDPRPTTTNSAPGGAKAAYLVLEALGRKTSRWNKPLADLNGEMDDAEAARTTLVLAEPVFDPTEFKSLQQELQRFLERGGRVLATGDAAELLPGGETKQQGALQAPVCHTTPEGPGPLARAGSVEMDEEAQWAGKGARFEVAQRCGSEAVVVTYAVGKGEVVWWSSAAPLENDELKTDADLRLLLASVGDGREVVFDESLHGAVKSIWDFARGLPLKWLTAQTALLFGLLLLSFSRRRGPVRMPVALPRSSPVEFAESMGDLYAKAGATSAATNAARRRLLRVLVREAGVAQQTVQEGPEAIAETLQERLGGDWSALAEHLMRCSEAQSGKIAARSALTLVKALNEDVMAVRARLKQSSTAVNGQDVAATAG